MAQFVLERLDKLYDVCYTISMNTKHFLTTQEAAEALGVSRGRVYHYIKEGRLPAQRLGRDWLISPEDVANFERQPSGYPKGKPRSEGSESSK